ncbi:MAG: hypothetical protein H7123_08010 [Thermoleophilia bacterium]|nr:hypothetical protein [Thermoleophilia bacterium]
MTVINIAWENAVRRDVTVEPYSQRPDATWDAIGIVARDAYLAGSGSFVDGVSSPEPIRAALDSLANVVARQEAEFFHLDSNFSDDNYALVAHGEVGVFLKDHDSKRTLRWRGPIDHAPAPVKVLLAAASALDKASALRVPIFDGSPAGAPNIDRHHCAPPAPLGLVTS